MFLSLVLLEFVFYFSVYFTLTFQMYVSIFQKKNYSQNKNKRNVAVNVPGSKFVCVFFLSTCNRFKTQEAFTLMDSRPIK